MRKSAIVLLTLWLGHGSQAAFATPLSPPQGTENIEDNATNLVPPTGLWERFTHNLSQTWNAKEYELYVPLNTWHNRWLYDDDKIDEYNERPWGIGFGNYRYDADNNWHSLYAMAFMDSHNRLQPILGYGYQKMWLPEGDLDGWRLGVGFTLSITARHEYYYIPMPLPLPLVSLEYKRFSLQSAYVPGTYNNGNVLFTWMRWQL